MPDLIALLKDDEKEVRANAALALADIGEPAKAALGPLKGCPCRSRLAGLSGCRPGGLPNRSPVAAAGAGAGEVADRRGGTGTGGCRCRVGRHRAEACDIDRKVVGTLVEMLRSREPGIPEAAESALKRIDLLRAAEGRCREPSGTRWSARLAGPTDTFPSASPLVLADQ